MKRKSMYKAISKGLITFGIVGSLSLSSGISYAAGNIAAIANDLVVEEGEEFSAMVVLSGDGNYDVYAGITGGVFGTDIVAFDANGALVPWDVKGPPVKLRDNVDLASLSTKEKTILLFPRIPLDSEYAGNYSIYSVLSKPGQFQQELQNNTLHIEGPLNIEVKGGTQ